MIIIEERYLCVNGVVYMVDNNIWIILWNDENEKKGFLLDGDIFVFGLFLMQDGKMCDFMMIDWEFLEIRYFRSVIVFIKEGDIMLVVVDGRVEGYVDGMFIVEFVYFL